MRRRDAIANHTWLRRLDSDMGADGRIATSVACEAMTAADLLQALSHAGYMVELWMDGAAIRGRCYPLHGRALISPAVALSYSGLSIWGVLAAAWSDLCRLADGYVSYDHSIREVVRWAP